MSGRCFCCDDWAANIPKIDAPFQFMVARNPQVYRGYDGKTFTHCPWCGTRLKDTDPAPPLPPTHPVKP